MFGKLRVKYGETLGVLFYFLSIFDIYTFVAITNYFLVPLSLDIGQLLVVLFWFLNLRMF